MKLSNSLMYFTICNFINSFPAKIRLPVVLKHPRGFREQGVRLEIIYCSKCNPVVFSIRVLSASETNITSTFALPTIVTLHQPETKDILKEEV